MRASSTKGRADKFHHPSRNRASIVCIPSYKSSTHQTGQTHTRYRSRQPSNTLCLPSVAAAAHERVLRRVGRMMLFREKCGPRRDGKRGTAHGVAAHRQGCERNGARVYHASVRQVVVEQNGVAEVWRVDFCDVNSRHVLSRGCFRR